MELNEVRAQLDEIDAELLRLFVRRMELIDIVADIKQKDTSRPVYDPVRERAILMKVRENVAGTLLIAFKTEAQANAARELLRYLNFEVTER